MASLSFTCMYLPLFTFLTFIASTSLNPGISVELGEYSFSNIMVAVKMGCVLVALQPGKSATLLATLRELSKAFVMESRVNIGILKQFEGIPWNNSNSAFLKEDEDLAFFYQKKLDRTCLIQPSSWETLKVKAQHVPGGRTALELLSFLNSKCETFRELDGRLSAAGETRERILQNLYFVPRNLDVDGTRTPVNVGATCERIPLPSKEEFFNDYFFRSKPVIITGALKKWPAIQKWSSEFLKTNFGNRIVRVAFAPNGEYEGCDQAKHFNNFKEFNIPEIVKSQLPFPDLVVVRPAFLEIPFSKFMEIIQSLNNSNVSAYLEYSSIPSLLPELEKDIREMPFVAGKLERRHLNIWLSNGNTLGKLHFDPFDNFLCQISGKKQLFLYEPHNNTKLYEAHIQEATLSYNPGSMDFHRQRLLDSTSMVMSPVDILHPDYSRFPEFREAQAMNCTINEGDVLFMPSFWWHEVQSYPSESEPRNVAVNFWYEPFFTKEFPCASCKIDVNSFYYNMLGQ